MTRKAPEIVEVTKPRLEALRDVGDKCLLYSGFFPQRAERRRVQVSYYVDLGRSAYEQLSDHMATGLAATYQLLATGFVAAMDVLQAMRTLNAYPLATDAFRAYELWQDTGSRYAYQQITTLTDACPAPQAASTRKPQ